MDSTNLAIRAEVTPNPASMRFILDRPVLENGVEFTDPAQAERSPLARRLFALATVAGVYLGPNFITVTAERADWTALRDQVIAAIQAHFATDEPVLLESPNGPPASTEEVSEIVAGIIRVIEEEIRPAVAMDGGDVVFVSYEDGVVYLRLRGACSGCPSALFTLKMGIERLLREEFPQIRAVEAVR